VRVNLNRMNKSPHEPLRLEKKGKIGFQGSKGWWLQGIQVVVRYRKIRKTYEWVDKSTGAGGRNYPWGLG